jgi:hypothetical protein
MKRLGGFDPKKYGGRSYVGPNYVDGNYVDGGYTGTQREVSRDATSGIYVPATAAEWSSFLAAKGLSSISVPTGLYLCQEESGDLAPAIGAVPLIASGTSLAYQQAITGWSRKGAGVSVDGASGTFSSTDASLPSINTTSMTTLAIVSMPSPPAAARTILQEGTTPARVDLVNTPHIRAYSATNSVIGTTDPTGAVRPVAIKHDRTNLVTTVYTDQEKLTPTFGTTTTGKRLSFGAGTNTAAVAYCLYLAYWSGASAEISDANMKALEQAMGFTIPWS